MDLIKVTAPDNMHRYKIIVAYDGTDYHGWQEQANKPTIAGILQQSFKKVFKHDIKLLAASRTDAGVHALGQVATFTINFTLEPAVLLRAWNNKLPPAVHIKTLEEVSLTFNPHKNILEKMYNYVIALERPLPFDARFAWYYRRHVDEQKFRNSLNLFLGKHDFRSFCASDYSGTTVRLVHEITLERINNRYVITFKAPGFLRYMIRRIVGASLYVASHKALTVDDLKKVLLACNPEHTLESAPACGLVLVEIAYN